MGQLAGLVIAVVCLHGQVCSAAEKPNQQELKEALRIFESLGETRKGLNAVKRVVDDIDGDIAGRQKRLSVCDISAGNAGYACYLQTLSSMDQAKSWLGSDLLSPGKRSAPSGMPINQLAPLNNNAKLPNVRSELTDLSKKRRGLDILRRILSEMEADLILEQKRTCQFNLGGHCATESAASVADHWHYLNSAMSPGRKRRDTGLYRKLMTGKLFPQDH
nr:calcitonin-2 [Urechis unicinctus]